jgi:predicted thioesterase
MVLTLGMKADTDLVVGAGDTASAMMSGDVAVLATPRLVALLEAAAVAAVRDVLADHQTTVGSHIDLRHLAPSPVGSHIVASAELVAVEGRRLTFRVTAVMGDELVGDGTHTRVIVDRARFGN